MTTAKKRNLDSISDGPARSEPKAKRHRTVNRCRLTELPDELLIMIAEHLAGFDDPITYVHRMDGKLIVDYAKPYHSVALASLRGLSDTLCIEFEKALHRNGIIAFEDDNGFAEYFNPEVLNSHPRLTNIRQATRRIRFSVCSMVFLTKVSAAMRMLVNLEKVHLGGAWRDEKGTFRPTPSKWTLTSFESQACILRSRLIHSRLGRQENPVQHMSFGPGRFGYNTIQSVKDTCMPFDGGDSDADNHVTLDELLAIWDEGQGTLDGSSSIIPMPKKTLSSIRESAASLKVEETQRAICRYMEVNFPERGTRGGRDGRTGDEGSSPS